MPAQFTSLIGFFKYAETYGLSAHQAAALVIARRALGFEEKVPKGLLKKLLGHSPMEGWEHRKLWGRLFGLFKAAWRKFSFYCNLKGFTPSRWCEVIFAGAG
ncbi:MAG: hypothetical protein ACPLPR_06960 [Bacillota bacterium]